MLKQIKTLPLNHFRSLKCSIFVVALLLLAALAPCARANSTTITVPGNNALIFMANPLDNGSGNSFLGVMVPAEAGMTGGENVWVWDCSEQLFKPLATLFYPGAGADYGAPSDWLVEDAAYQILYGDYDVVNDVYWLDPAKSPPSLPPGTGFFFQNPNSLAEPLTFYGSVPMPAASPQPCGSCGSFNAIASLYTATADFQQVAGSAPVDGSQLQKWNGSGWYIFTYVCGGWVAGANVPGGVQPTVDPGQSVMAYSPCSAPGVVVVTLNGPAVTAPGWGFPYVIAVDNFSGSASAAATLTLAVVASSGTPGLTPPTGYATAGPLYFTITLPPLAPCSSTSFYFDTGCGTVPVGGSLTLNASLDIPSTPAAVIVNVVASLDPNEKTGPAGVGPHHYLIGSTALPYSITFENQPAATAPAQRVMVTDQLDPTTMDFGSFQFGPITFGSEQVTPPAGVNPYHDTVLSYNAGGHIINVQISATNDVNFFSPTYGKVTWAFQSLDPGTGLPPSNPLIGFLLPNTSPPAGQGMVTFTVNPLSGLVTGDLITNSASVVFDVNSAIVTGTWTNTIIKTTPALAITRAAAGQVRITWGGWTLQEADSLKGPWGNTSVQVSPWQFTPPVDTKFYRLQAP